ncbi:hypothetical protein V9T40_009815 [Parthenolecanium corni]|uniref:Uncharacterized protein n=1 Tax=Parthenolecanium corni TaxID=536013 RepID=A0AAN9TY32_9HEMI
MKKLQVLDKTYAFYPPILNTLKKERKKKKKNQRRTTTRTRVRRARENVASSPLSCRRPTRVFSTLDARRLQTPSSSSSSSPRDVLRYGVQHPARYLSRLQTVPSPHADARSVHCDFVFRPLDRRAPRERDSPPTIRRKRRVLGPTTRADPSNYFIAYSTMDGDSSDERMIVDLGHGRRPRATPASDGFSPERLRP